MAEIGGVAETEYGLLLFASIALGFCIGLYYEFFRFLRIALPHPAFLVSLEDLIFFLPLGPLIIFFHYALSDGIFRWFSLVGCLAGFLLYLGTLGRLLTFFSKTILGFVKAVLRFLFSLLLRPLVIVFKKITNCLLSRARKLGILIKEKRRKRSLVRKERQLLHLAGKGFIN